MNSISPYDFEIQRTERRRQRARTFLLYEAFHRAFSKGKLHLAYRVGDAFFFRVTGRSTPLPAEVKNLKRIMLRAIKDDRPLESVKLTKRQALDRLIKPGMEKTYSWIKDMRDSLPVFYRGTDRLLAFKGPLVGSTGDVGIWDLIPYPPGILLRVAPPDSDSLPPYCESPALFRTFFEAERWGMIHGASYISDVNRLIGTGEIEYFVQVAQSLQARKIAAIADRINDTQPRPRVVLISGPSASGKTCFSRLLFIQLRLLGLDPITLSLDNYYRQRTRIPLNSNNQPDYEALEALDIESFNEDLLRLAAGEEVQIPALNFKTHRKKPGKTILLNHNGILIIEGIHGLNPDLTPHLTEPSVFRVFVSALNHLNLDELSRVSTTDLRLLRRIVRDQRSRGYSAEDTLSRWNSVREGEQSHIFPFQEMADAMFNSAMPFELNALKPLVINAFKQVNNKRLKTETKRLKTMLDAVKELPVEWTERHVCPTSIFREFFGGSLLID